MTPALRVACALILAAGCDGVIADPSASGGPGGDGARRGPNGELLCDPCVGISEMQRLTRSEYERSIRAALGDAVALDDVRFDHLPPDGSAGPFASNAFFAVDADGVEAYRAVAEAVAEQAAAAAEALLACEGTAGTECVEAFVDRTGRRLYRRPLDATEASTYVALFDSAAASGTIADGVRLAITAMLQSPFFLYRVERGTEVDDGLYELSGHEMAARLAAFLWRSSPDDVLLAAASAGELATAAGIEAQARRMLADPRADYAIVRFHLEWLGVADVTTHSVDESRFPEFPELSDDMLDETERFALHVFREGDARLEDLLTAPYTFASPELAAHYGSTPDAAGRVDLDPAERAGLLTHASFLAAHVNDPKTAAVHRGRTVRESLLCQELPLPPPVDTIIAPDPTLSTRQQLEQKTSPPSCAACHQLMNPLGFAFGHYDAIGGWQDTDGEHPIDATGTVAESDVPAEFDGAVELAHALSESDQVHRCITRQWMRFALARPERVDDEPSIDEAFAAYEASGRDLRELIVAITTTDAFRHRRVPAP